VRGPNGVSPAAVLVLGLVRVLVPGLVALAWRKPRLMVLPAMTIPTIPLPEI